MQHVLSIDALLTKHRVILSDRYCRIRSFRWRNTCNGLGRCPYIGGSSTIVTAGAGSAPVNIVSTGGNTVWASQTTINYTGGGASQIVMGATAGDSGTVNLIGDASSSADITQVDVWGSSGTTASLRAAARPPSSVPVTAPYGPVA